MPLWARKKDAVHAEVVQALKACGWSVVETWRAPECPDLFASKAGRTIAVEVKTRARSLTAQQSDFKGTWQGEYHVLTSVEDVLRLVRAA